MSVAIGWVKMKNKDLFSAYHPIINFLYFALTIGITMFFMHPIILMISLISACAYGVCLNGSKTLVFSVKYMLPVILFTAVLNPAFNHQGKTLLMYFPSGNALTLESAVYGVAAGLMLAAILIWFNCFSNVISSDKFVYLFGRIIPALSLVLSMTLRLVPKFKRQLHEVSDSQRALGRDVSSGSLRQRTKTALSIFSVMITWALEDSIETADSMKSRGYGTKKRSAFSIYTWSSRDTRALIYLLIPGVFVIISGILGGLFWRYFPDIKGTTAQPISILSYISFALICITPIYIDEKEALRWHSLN